MFVSHTISNHLRHKKEHNKYIPDPSQPFPWCPAPRNLLLKTPGRLSFWLITCCGFYSLLFPGKWLVILECTILRSALASDSRCERTQILSTHGCRDPNHLIVFIHSSRSVLFLGFQVQQILKPGSNKLGKKGVVSTPGLLRTDV